ncbi:MAG: hypothetical protein ACHQWU_12770 [Gemmatimonadales bacterium]
MMTAPLPKADSKADSKADPTLSNPPPRWYRYRRRGAVCCPENHHFPNKQRIPESGFLRCGHWMHAEHRECGRWVFLLAIRGGGSIIAEVHLDELAELETMSTPGEVFEYLGILDDETHLPVNVAAATGSTADRPAAGAPRRHHDRR